MTKSTSNHPEFGLIVNDDYKDLQSRLLIVSNSGSDMKKTLVHAKKNKLKRPILLEVECSDTSCRLNNFALTVDEAKEVIRELHRMIDYLEE